MPLPDPPPLGEAMLPPRSYEGEVVAVTGGGTGLGKAIAVEFARLGAGVGVLSRGEEHRKAGVTAVEEAGGRAVDVSCDVRDPDAIAAAFDTLERELGPVSSLINNAAGNFPAEARHLSPNGWRSVLGICLDGTFFCSTEFARRRIAAEQPGAIVNIGATYSFTGGPGTAHSAAAKAGINSLTQSLAVEWAPFGVRINTLIPGPFPHDDQPEYMHRGPGRPASERAKTTPAGRIGHPRELGWAATYMCSPYAAYLNGHILILDGGNWLRRGLSMPEFTPAHEWVPETRGER